MFFKRAFLFLLAIFYSFTSWGNFIELEIDHYSSKPIIPQQIQTYSFLKGMYDFDLEKRGLDFRSQFQFEHSLDFTKWFYFEIPHFFLSYKYDFKKDFYNIQSIEVSLGRKKQSWSEGDSYWGFGLWNPLILWNPLHPKEKGSVGSFLTLNANRWKSDFFIGAFHFPDSVPHFQEKNQETYTHSRWGAILPKKVDRYDLNIYYTLNRTFVFDYINQRSFFASFSTWSQVEESRYWIRWSIAYKPTNHIYYLLNDSKRLRISATESHPDAMYVDQHLTGVNARQRILSTEWGLNYKKLSMIFSLENANIKDDSLLENKGWSFFRSAESFTYFSMLTKYQYLDKGFFEMGFLQSWFEDYNSYSQNDILPVFLTQHRISNGFSIAFDHQGFYSKNLPYSLKLKYQYSFSNKGGWLSTEFLFYLSSKVYTKLSANILGVGISNEIPSSFLENFYYNDYFTWSLAYDF